MGRLVREQAVPRGFTLLEMLVVLILTGMISTLLFQALQQVFRLETHFGRELFISQEGEMYTEWFRQTVNGLVPDHPSGRNRFAGNGREIAGLTISPIDTMTGSLVPFAWHLRFDAGSGRTQLRYGTGEKAMVVMEWPGNSGRFVFYDGKDQAHDSWPPALGKWPQLPKAVFLETMNPLDRRVVVAVPRGPDEALPRQRDYTD